MKKSNQEIIEERLNKNIKSNRIDVTYKDKTSYDSRPASFISIADSNIEQYIKSIDTLFIFDSSVRITAMIALLFTFFRAMIVSNGSGSSLLMGLLMMISVAIASSIVSCLIQKKIKAAKEHIMFNAFTLNYMDLFAGEARSKVREMYKQYGFFSVEDRQRFIEIFTEHFCNNLKISEIPDLEFVKIFKDEIEKVTIERAVSELEEDSRYIELKKNSQKNRDRLDEYIN